MPPEPPVEGGAADIADRGDDEQGPYGRQPGLDLGQQNRLRRDYEQRRRAKSRGEHKQQRPKGVEGQAASPRDDPTSPTPEFGVPDILGCVRYIRSAALVGSGIGRIVTSPLIRALRTAAVVAEYLDRPVHIERRLIERSYGAFDGQVIREVKARHGLRSDQSSRDILPADADPWTEIFDRIPPVIAHWMAAHAGEQLLFVSHSGVFDALHEHMLGAHRGSESRHGMPYLAEPTAAGWVLQPLL